MSESRDDGDIFSKRLRAVRELRGLSQAELAARAKLQPAAISHFEAGARRPSFDNLKRLASALQATTDYLLGRVDSLDANPTADVAFRNYQNLSDRDRSVIQGIINQMTHGGTGGTAERADDHDTHPPSGKKSGGGERS